MPKDSKKEQKEQRQSFALDGDKTGMTVSDLVLGEMKAIVAAPAEMLARGKTERMGFHISSAMRRKIEMIVYNPKTPYQTFSDFFRDASARMERIAQLKWFAGEVPAETMMDLIILEAEDSRVKSAKARELEAAIKNLAGNGSRDRAIKYVKRMQQQLEKMPDDELAKALEECPTYKELVGELEKIDNDTPDK